MLETGGSVSDMEVAVAVVAAAAAAAVHIVRKLLHIAEVAAVVLCWGLEVRQGLDEVAIAGSVGRNILAAWGAASHSAEESHSHMTEGLVTLDRGALQRSQVEQDRSLMDRAGELGGDSADQDVAGKDSPPWCWVRVQGKTVIWCDGVMLEGRIGLECEDVGIGNVGVIDEKIGVTCAGDAQLLRFVLT
jgi:hypothetical protein